MMYQASSMLRKFTLLAIAGSFIYYPPLASAQCLDTNTLLDSIHSISLSRLNVLRRFHESKSKSAEEKLGLDSIYRVNHRNRGDIYQPLLFDKLFKTKDYFISSLDKSFFYLGDNHKDKFITKVRWRAKPGFHTILLSDAFHNQYLATVSKELLIISLFAFDTQELPFYVAPFQASKSVHALNQSGITSNLSEDGIITQTSWSTSKNARTMSVLQSKKKTVYYKINSNGKISHYTVKPQNKAVKAPASRRW
ncbi:hypothetical protein [Hymenobacter saemangeumensis]|uniref:hypothetical protein n=1 Tax=Hymenobacter saemangeumensis TaxID=1084522 RepID=UPI0031E75C4C